MGPGCGLSQEMNWRIWSGLRVITHHQGWGHLKTGHYMRRRVWSDQLDTEEAEQSLHKTPLFQDLGHQGSGKSLSLFHRNTPQFTPMSEPVLWCNVQSAVLPGICGLDWLLRRDHSLPQSSEELVTVNKAVMVYTNSARYHQCEPSYEMYLQLTVRWLWMRLKSIFQCFSGLNILVNQGLPCSGTATRPGLIITVKFEPSDNNLPRRMIRWTPLGFFNHYLIGRLNAIPRSFNGTAKGTYRSIQRALIWRSRNSRALSPIGACFLLRWKISKFKFSY